MSDDALCWVKAHGCSCCMIVIILLKFNRDEMVQSSKSDYYFHPCSCCGATSFLFPNIADRRQWRATHECRKCSQLDIYKVSADSAVPWNRVNAPEEPAPSAVQSLPEGAENQPEESIC